MERHGGCPDQWACLIYRRVCRSNAARAARVLRRRGKERSMSSLQIGWQQLWSIVGKDLRSELRARQVWASMALFSALVLVVFYFAFDLRVENNAAVAPGALWIAFVFASVLGLGRT